MQTATAKKKNISVIPSQPEYDRSIKPQFKTLRVAAYCRVSTTLEQQESSYEAQVSYYTEKLRVTTTGSLPAFMPTMEKARPTPKSAMTSTP